jgi:3-oxoacyl-[acyl-carrier protein] reductase
MTKLTGKTALITGGGAGIGAAIASRLAADGASVFITYHSHVAEADSVVSAIRAAGGSASAAQLDVTNPTQVVSLVSEVAGGFGGHLDILINNAGNLIKRVPIAEMEENFWHAVIDVNLGSVYRVTKATIPYMTRGWGRIVNLSSLAAFDGGGPGAAAYAAAKGGVLTLTRGLAKELAPKGITVNAVSPGYIADTGFHNTFTSKEAQQGMVDRSLVKRGGSVNDVAAAVAYLVSPDAGFVTGEVIQLNGGVVFL